MTDDFALIDFALSTRPADEIVRAIGRAQSAGALVATPEPRRGSGPGFLGRLMNRDAVPAAPPSKTAPLTVQPSGTLPTAIVRQRINAPVAVGGSGDVRISGPHGRTSMTLIEFREGDDLLSGFCQGLSAELPGEELFRFRHSGSNHPGAFNAFQVYVDGRSVRNACSQSHDGIAPEADWQGVDHGMPHPFETDSLPAPAAPKSEIMTPARLANILNMIGVEPDALFDVPRDAMSVFELRADLRGTPLETAADAVPVPQVAAPPAPQPVTRPPNAGLAPWEAQQPAPSWEEEVTMLLLKAAQSGLPPEDQVNWLTALTQKLETGEIDAALEDALHVIGAGSLSDADKIAAIERLASLFGRGA